MVTLLRMTVDSREKRELISDEDIASRSEPNNILVDVVCIPR